MNLNIIDIFSNFIDNLDIELRSIFNEYFLGSNTTNPITIDEYYAIVKESLEAHNDCGYRRVMYNKISPVTYIHKKIKLYSQTGNTLPSIYIAKRGYEGYYPPITIDNYEYYTSIVFLIHKLIDYDTINLQKLSILAGSWYDYSIGYLLGVPTLHYIYRYANANEIYFSNRKLSAAELKKLKIYTNRIKGKEILCYE